MTPVITSSKKKDVSTVIKCSKKVRKRKGGKTTKKVGETTIKGGKQLLFVRTSKWKMASWKRKTATDYYARPLLKKVSDQGECVYESPSLEVLQEYCKMQVDGLWEEVKRFENPHSYYVDMSQKMWDLKYNLLKNFK